MILQAANIKDYIDTVYFAYVFLLSSPQLSLFLRLSKKLWVLKVTNEILKSAFFMLMHSLSAIWAGRESRVIRLCSARLSISMVKIELSSTTIGRTFRLCGAMGVRVKQPVPGISIGPPQLRL